MGTRTTEQPARDASQRDGRPPIAKAAGEDRDRRRTSLWHSLFPLLGGRAGPVAVLATASVLAALTEAAILAVVAQIAAALVSASHSVDAHVGFFDIHSSIGTMLVVALMLAVVRLILQLPTSFIPARVAADVQGGLRDELFDAFTRASWETQSRDREGHFQELMTSQVLQATQGALQAATFITSLCTFVILVGSALVLNVGVALVVLAACAVLFGLLRPLNALGARRASALSEAQMNYANGVGEAIRLAEDTHVFGVSSAQRTRIGKLTAAAQRFFFHTQLLARLVPNMYQSLIYLIIVGGLGLLYVAGNADVASLGAVVLLLVRAGAAGQQMQGSHQYVRHAQPFISRLEEAKDAYISSFVVAGAMPLPEVRTLAFDHISYSYRKGRSALSDISFEVRLGETIGIVGPSGAGKSTLVQILLQLRKSQEGRYLVNGEPAAVFSPHDWSRHVAYVPQEPRLVHATVADNISFFRGIERSAVEEAARLARIHDEIAGWRYGYDTIVGPRADAVSGGQQQRICLARALAANPDVLVLDEPTSALDPRSETLIHESLAALKGSVTMFIVAHKMSSLDICDRVLVVVDGTLEAFDTPDALRDGSSYYRSALWPLDPSATAL